MRSYQLFCIDWYGTCHDFGCSGCLALTIYMCIEFLLNGIIRPTKSLCNNLPPRELTEQQGIEINLTSHLCEICVLGSVGMLFHATDTAEHVQL